MRTLHSALFAMAACASLSRMSGDDGDITIRPQTKVIKDPEPRSIYTPQRVANKYMPHTGAKQLAKAAKRSGK